MKLTHFAFIMDFDFRLKVFFTAAQHLNFTKAAAALYISQPAISQNIIELEKKLCVSLFDRKGNNLELTAEGCHGQDGQGQKIEGGKGYTYPPLWGPDSYNDGAGMNRVITAAKFIKGNMPLGATHDSPILTDEEAFDVAAYINSFDRPQKANKEKDYPNLSKKPKDCSYPPYIDNISQEQHKYGPFNF